MFIFNQRFINYSVFCTAAAVFLVSVMSQFFLNKEPCQLCLITRYMFLSVAVAAIFFERLRILLSIVTFITVGFSFYHLGVENHWWQGPHGCISELPTLDSIDDPVQIKPGKVYCDRVNWLILGVSSTLWSFLISMVLFWLSSVSFILNYYLRKIEDDD